MWGVDVSSVYLHSVICETYLMYQYSIDLLSIGVGYWGRCMLSICDILLHVKLIWHNGHSIHLLFIYVGGLDISSVYVHSAICETYLM